MDSSNNESGLTTGGEYAVAERIDARGLRCPMPLLKAKQALNRVSPGELVQVFATDAGAARDFPAFANLSGHELLRHMTNEDGVMEFVIKKRKESSL